TCALPICGENRRHPELDDGNIPEADERDARPELREPVVAPIKAEHLAFVAQIGESRKKICTVTCIVLLRETFNVLEKEGLGLHLFDDPHRFHEQVALVVAPLLLAD